VPEAESSRVEQPEAGVNGRRQVAGADRPSCRPAQLGQIDLVERRQEKQPLDVCAERRQSRCECLLEASSQWQRR
jgi:hypothetical protein